MHLVTGPNLNAPDDFYEALIDAHRDLSREDSHALNARLVLLLANHIGSLDVLREALQAARDGQALTHNPTEETTEEQLDFGARRAPQATDRKGVSR